MSWAACEPRSARTEGSVYTRLSAGSEVGDDVRGDERDRALLELGVRVEDADRVEPGIEPPADLGDDLVRRPGQREVLHPLVRHLRGDDLLAAALHHGR